jgi:hypothetical protein
VPHGIKPHLLEMVLEIMQKGEEDQKDAYI